MTAVRPRPQQKPAVMVQHRGGALDRCPPSASFLADQVISAARSKYRGQRKQHEQIDQCVLLHRNTARISFSNGGSGAEAHVPEAQAKAEKRADAPVCSLDLSIVTRNTDSEMLQSIYDSIKELQTETRAERRRGRLATKRLQGTVRKVVKSCTEIEEKLSTMEERTMAVEGDVVTLREQTTAHDGQLSDIM
ncbi:hypothetical protein NDU88_001454 [Pleurodeles waltl]|uniref:Uncharacterized protein n=1 Tax=Pleurodeles waltl TaxID=8319 RepID=A0AAV7USS9_PLEWA|nr:hypothetical protein NDU88_001452 [Pleurodeles waltl]KAJ1192142.1 hypothetical protein NDU88_001454 [Pleurodeles waltl]